MVLGRGTRHLLDDCRHVTEYRRIQQSCKRDLNNFQVELNYSIPRSTSLARPMFPIRETFQKSIIPTLEENSCFYPHAIINYSEHFIRPCLFSFPSFSSFIISTVSWPFLYILIAVQKARNNNNNNNNSNKK